MSGENVESVVGLIEIELLSDEGPDRAVLVDCDATLGELLIHLARDGTPTRDSLETSRLGRLPAANRRLAGETQLSARLEDLVAELELAVAQVRRKIAAAQKPAA